MTQQKDALPELTNLALLDRILVSADNLVYARAKGITLSPHAELGNLKQITECGAALREVLLKEDALKRLGYYLQRPRLLVGKPTFQQVYTRIGRSA